MEHSRFISSLLDPSERKLVTTVRQVYHFFPIASTKFSNPSPNTLI
nr:DUF2935 domain-containing protein [Anoxybacillus vitaminiphilus]